jgi:hypothetical protein
LSPESASVLVKSDSPNISLVVVIGAVDRWIICKFPDERTFITHRPLVDMLMKSGTNRDNYKVIHIYPQVFVDIHWVFSRISTGSAELRALSP